MVLQCSCSLFLSVTAVLVAAVAAHLAVPLSLSRRSRRYGGITVKKPSPVMLQGQMPLSSLAARSTYHGVKLTTEVGYFQLGITKGTFLNTKLALDDHNLGSYFNKVHSKYSVTARSQLWEHKPHFLQTKKEIVKPGKNKNHLLLSLS